MTAPKLTEAQRTGLRMCADGHYASLCIMNGKLAAQLRANRVLDVNGKPNRAGRAALRGES